MRVNLRHTIAVCAVLLGLSTAVPAGAQSRTDEQMAKAQSELTMAESALASAEAAGAATLAKPLYDESMMQIRQARANWNDSKRDMREDAIMRAVEARHAARAAEAHALLVGTNTEVRNLRTEIGSFGGNPATVSLYDPPMAISRGVTSMDRVIVAENAVKAAREVGGDLIAGNELEQAEQTLKTARTLAKNRKQSESADHLAYVAEMQARRAEYLARRNAVTTPLASLRAERTRLAQQQLAAQSVNREAERTELEQLRQQVAQTEAEVRARLDEDRAARIAAEARVDDLTRRYQASLVEGSATSIEAEELRRQVDEQSLALRSLQERERLSETSMINEINALQRDLERERTEGRLTAETLAQREQEINRQRADLQRLRSEREESERRRIEAENVRAAAIAEAERRRTEAENQAAQLRQQVAEQQARTTQTEAELARARDELARRDAAAAERITAMQTELAKLAQTRTSERGFIVTLPGLFFDTGKAVLKPGARNTLNKIAEQLRMNPDARIEIEGHTDSVGSEELNQALSEKRAKAVRDYLAGRGLPEVRISMTGLGESTPVASNDTPAGRQQNRRVELVIAPAPQVSSQQ